MRHVEIHAFIPNEKATRVFDVLADFKLYERLVDVVHSVDVTHQNEITHSSWVVEFGIGFLRWVEEDWFRRDELQLDFNQLEGDFDEFYGGWKFRPENEGVRASLIVDFDFGVPSLASIVEPVAERVLTDVTKQILRSLFGEPVVFLDEINSRLVSEVKPELSTQKELGIESQLELSDERSIPYKDIQAVPVMPAVAS